MNTITIWNKGRRTWPMKNAEGVEVKLEPQESVQVEEVYGLRMVAAYPKDLTTSGVAAPSLDDIKRREQSVNDREKHLDAREKALDEREKALEKIEIPESVEKLIEKIELECFEQESSARPDGFIKEKFAEIITAYIAANEPAPAKPRGRPAKADKAD